MINSMYKKPTPDIIIGNRLNSEYPPPKSGIRQECSLSCLPVNIVLEVLDRELSKKKRSQSYWKRSKTVYVQMA